MSDRKRPRVAGDERYSLAALMGPPDPALLAADPASADRWDCDMVRFARAQLAAKVLDQATAVNKFSRRIAEYQEKIAALRAVPDALVRLAEETRAALRRLNLKLPNAPPPAPDKASTEVLLNHYLADIRALLALLTSPVSTTPSDPIPDLQKQCKHLQAAADKHAALKNLWDIKEADLKSRLEDAVLELAHRRQQLAKYRHQGEPSPDKPPTNHTSVPPNPDAPTQTSALQPKSSSAIPNQPSANSSEPAPSPRPSPKSSLKRPVSAISAINGEKQPGDVKTEQAAFAPSNAGPTSSANLPEETSNLLRTLQRDNAELKATVEMKAKEIAQNLEERKRLLLELESGKIALAVKPDLDQIVASALYHTMEVSLQQCLLKQRDWERERLLLIKERDALRDGKERQYKTLTETNDRKVAQLESQLTESIRVAEQAKSIRDKLQLQYETKKLGAGAEERAKTAEEQLDTLRSRYDALTKEWAKLSDDFKLRCHEIDQLRSEVSKNATGSTQLAIEQLQREIKSEREKSSGFMVEIESLSAVFADMETQNRKLSQSLGAKDETLVKLNSERLKHKQQVISIKEENKVLLSKMQAEEDRSKHLQRALEASRKQNAESSDAVHRASEEAAARQALAEERKRIADEAVERERAALVEIDESNRARDAAYARLQELIPRHQDHLSLIRKHEEKITLLENRVAAEAKPLRIRPTNNSQKMSQEEREFLQHYRSKLHCSVNPSLPKDVTLQKCGHCFSRKCVDDLISMRNRKCPVCHEKFGQDDVRRIYLG